MTNVSSTTQALAPGTVPALVQKLRLDRRKRYCEWQGKLCTIERVTIDCPGCTEHVDYGERHGPYGCSECGHTGKRRITVPYPVMVDGEWVMIQNKAVTGPPMTTANTTEPRLDSDTVHELVVCPHSGRHKACRCCPHSIPHARVVERGRVHSACDAYCEAHRARIECSHNAPDQTCQGSHSSNPSGCLVRYTGLS